ncbi:hypothetical protein [Cupriavidus plantarum]|uniref:hypothetical protein n=1 Tax=Cupriavidus plantarum TaxID=942865 RepID=UPI00339D98B7
MALATLIGGSAGVLLGANATAASLAAQNEALNNSTSDKVVKWAKDTYQDPLGDLARWGKQFLGMLPGQTPPAEANPLVDQTKGGDPPATGGAVVTPPTMSCSPSGQCVVTPAIASPGAPGNAIMSSGNGEEGRNTTNNSLPSNSSQVAHIFREDTGHLPNTPENQQTLLSLVNNPANLLGTDRFGNQWFAQLLPDGSQLWGSVRNGVVQNGGLNATPNIFNPATGLSRATK